MWFSKSNASKIFRSRALISLLAVFSLLSGAGFAQAQSAEENHSKATQDFLVTLSGLTAYSEYQSIRTALAKSEGMEKMVLDQEAPGFIALKASYAGEARGLIDSLETYFPKKYVIKEKHPTSQLTEISISK